jgi:hypothetical protein
MVTQSILWDFVIAKHSSHSCIACDITVHFSNIFARYFTQKMRTITFKFAHFPLGWCTIRPPLEDVNKEPGFAKGWGFCGKEEDQLTCDKQIDTSYQ